MRGRDVREVFESVLPDEALRSFIEAAGLQQRERKLDGLQLIRSAVIAASSGHGGRQAEVLRNYFEAGGEEVVRGAAYRWFGEAFEAVMEDVRDRALSYASSLPADLPGVLGRHVHDWIVVDSSTVRLDDALVEEYPGAGKYAALKVHKYLSLGRGTPIHYHLSPAREHDSPHLFIDEAWSGLGLLADLGYASLARLQSCEQHGVYFVIRLKDSWKPRVERIERGTLTAELLVDADFDDLLDEEVLLLDGESVDAAVRVGRGSTQVSCRLVGVPGPEGYCWYLTNLPTDASAESISDLYAVRWEIELDNKLDKSCHRLDEVGARNPATVRALVHASIVASVLIGLLAHHHRLEEGHAPRNRPYRTRPPIHPQRLGRMVATAASTIARALEATGPEADREWERIARLLVHQGTDPNWRRRPSVLDQLRGWKIRPKRPRRSKARKNSAQSTN